MERYPEPIYTIPNSFHLEEESFRMKFTGTNDKSGSLIDRAEPGRAVLNESCSSREAEAEAEFALKMREKCPGLNGGGSPWSSITSGSSAAGAPAEFPDSSLIDFSTASTGISLFHDSDNSESEGGSGNLNRLVIRPPGHSGKAKKGHLCFDASFETGNLGRVDLVSEFEYDLFVRPDTCNPRTRIWFNFMVDNTKADQKVIFNIVNFSKGKNLFELGMTPIMKSTSRPKWQRIPRKNIYYFKSPDHLGQHVLSICHGFDKEEDVYHFAFSFPFSYSKCQAHLKLLEQRQLPFFQRELLANSIQKRRVDLITIANPSIMESSKKQRIVVILARIHPGDSPTSFVCQGILDFLVSNHPIAICLRDMIIFKIVPMINPDGVFLGNHRSNLMGFDLNRNWHQVNEWAHPTLYAFQQMILDLDMNKSVSLDFILDLHANTSLPGVFVYGNTYDDVYRYERHIVFPKLLAQNADDYVAENTMYNRDNLKVGTTRRYFYSKLKDTTNCYTLEVSFFGYKKKDSSNYIVYSEDSYYRLGRNIVRTYLNYYHVIGVLTGNASPSVEIRAKASNPSEKKGKTLKRKSRASKMPRENDTNKPVGANSNTWIGK